MCEGSFLLVGLKPGEYQISALYDGVLQRKTLTIKADQHEKVSIYWRQVDTARAIHTVQ